MKAVKYMDENTLIKKSIEVLMEKLGPVETIQICKSFEKKKNGKCQTTQRMAKNAG